MIPCLDRGCLVIPPPDTVSLAESARVSELAFQGSGTDTNHTRARHQKMQALDSLFKALGCSSFHPHPPECTALTDVDTTRPEGNES